MNVTTDSEDDSNKGDSLNNTFKTAEESATEDGLSPLDIMSDNDELDAGKRMLSHFPPSECPVIVDITTNDPGNITGNKSTESLKAEDESCNDERTSGVSTVDDVVATAPVSVTDAMNSDLTKTDILVESSDVKNVDDLESQPVKRTGSFRLINNNGVLKVVDSGQTPVTSENVKEAKLLKTKSLEVTSTESDAEQSKSDQARKQLGETMSEAIEVDKEFQNVCENIATLEKKSEDVDISNELKNEGSKLDDLEQNNKDSSALVITVDNIVSTENTTKLTIEGVTTNESATDDYEDESREDLTNGSANEIDSPSSIVAKRQKPKRLANINRYSLGTESALLSPEDDIQVELTKMQSSSSLKRDKPPVSTSEDGVSTDGLPDEARPAPPPRVISQHKNLRYSVSFNTAGKVDGEMNFVTKRNLACLYSVHVCASL